MNKKLIIVLAVFTLVGVGLFYFLTMGNIGVKYNTVEVKRSEIGKYVQDTGRISSSNVRKYYGSGIGKIKEMPLKLGDRVKKGQLLVRYENRLDIEIKKIDKQIEALQAVYKDAQSGTDIAQLSSAKIEISRINSLLDLANTNLERTQSLYDGGAVPLTNLEQAKSSVNQLQSSLKVAQNTYSQLAKGISKNVRAKYEADIDVLLLSKEAIVKSKENYAVYADVDGVVTELGTFVGDNPYPGSMIIEIQDPTHKVVLVDFMVADAINIEPGMRAEVNDNALGVLIENLKVSRVYPKAFITHSELGVEENRQTVEIGLTESAKGLAFGIQVETKVMVEAPRTLLLVPVGTVIHKDSKRYVNVLEDGKLVEREIVTGIEVDGQIEVKEGLKEGEQVVLNYEEE